MNNTGNRDKGELLGPELRRRWSAAEKIAMVAETYEPGTTVSLVARRHGIAPNQLFLWRKLAGQGALTGGCWRRSGASLGVPGATTTDPGTATTAGQKDAGSRDP